MPVAPSIFKAYDIRGIYPDQLDERVAHAVGSVLGDEEAHHVVGVYEGPVVLAAAGAG